MDKHYQSLSFHDSCKLSALYPFSRWGSGISGRSGCSLPPCTWQSFKIQVEAYLFSQFFPGKLYPTVYFPQDPFAFIRSISTCLLYNLNGLFTTILIYLFTSPALPKIIALIPSCYEFGKIIKYILEKWLTDYQKVFILERGCQISLHWTWGFQGTKWINVSTLLVMNLLPP